MSDDEGKKDSKEPSLGQELGDAEAIGQVALEGGADPITDVRAAGAVVREAPSLLKKGLQVCLVYALMGAAFVMIFVITINNGGLKPDEANASTVGLAGTVTELQVNGKTIKLPSTKGKVGGEERVTALNAKGQHITFEKYCDAQEKIWYITMRWPYVEWAWNGTARSSDSTSSLFARQKILVYNPTTKKSVVVAICEAGPAPWTGSTWAAQHGNKSAPFAPYWTSYSRFDPPEADGRVAGLPPEPMSAIGAHTNDILEYGFLPTEKQNTPVGTVN